MAAVSRAAYLKSNTLQDTITSSFIILQRCVCVCGEGGDGGGGVVERFGPLPVV